MTPVRIKRPPPSKALISLVPLIDVMLILLVFFMVTSTYLDLDMMPAVDRTGQAAPNTAPPARAGAQTAVPMLIRIGSDGRPALRGRLLDRTDLAAAIRARLDAAPRTRILILPLAGARMQALISVMETATLAGATRLRVVRLEPLP